MLRILTTKLRIPPLRAGLVPRARLIERLNAGCRAGCRLILVSAPAGYGKTTLLSEWAKGQPVAWLTLDAGDNEPTRFAAHLTAALQTLDAAIGQDVLDALCSIEPPSLETLFGALANQIDAIAGPLVLVLDDYHAITALPIHQALAFLVDHLPSNMRVVLATRSDPLLPLARLRGRGQLLELRQDDLCFTTQETAQFLQKTMGLGLSAGDVAGLAERTEGWVAGLQMAALSLQGRADRAAFIQDFSGSHRYILEYLIEEVLNRQPDAVQAFLLKTAILEHLSGPLCDAVLGDWLSELGRAGFASSQAVLEYLERANLFLVALDDQGKWFRYHHLFADLLRQRFKQAAGTEARAALYLRASAWYEREGLVAEAVAYALAVPDYGYAVALIERHGLAMFYRSETALVHNWLRALPEELIRARPLLSALYANCLVLTRQSMESIAVAETWLQAAEAALVNLPGVKATAVPSRDEVIGFILKLRAYLARFRGDPPDRVAALSLQALESLPKDSAWFRSALYFNLGAAYRDLGDEEAAARAWAMARQVGESCGDLFNALSAVAAQAAVIRTRGRLHEAAAICREVLQSIVAPVEQAGRSLPAAGMLYVLLGSIQLQWNDLENAESALARGLALLALTAASLSNLEGHFALARLRQAQGDGDGALCVLEQAEQLYPSAGPRGPERPFRGGPALVAPHKAWLWVRQAAQDPDRLAEAERWAHEQDLVWGAGQYSVAQLVGVRLAILQHRLHITSGQPDLPALSQFLEQQLHSAQAKGWLGWQIEVSVLQALVRYVQGVIRPALAVLGQALVLAEPEGYVRVFVDEGPALAELLRLGVQQGAWREPGLVAYAGKLLDAFPGPGAPPGPPVPSSHLIEPLSERELEVLRLMGDGLSNRQIAERLVVTVGTVKTHVHNVYGKLGVERRTQAIARARELELL